MSRGLTRTDGVEKMVRAAAVCLLIAGVLGTTGVLLAQAPQVVAANRSVLLSNKSQVVLPMVFEANRGQAAAGVDFLATGQGYAAQVRADAIVLNVPRARNGKTGPAKAPDHTVVRIALSGANRRAKGQGENKSRAYSNYLFGSDPAKWITHVDQYEKVRYAGIYPGIDVLLHGNENRLEQDFVIHPAADPKQIRLKFDGVRDLRVSGDGDLVLRAEDISLRLQKPRAYEMVNGKEVEVAVAYEVQGRAVGFRLGSYDSRRELVIDPVLVFSTFFGGQPPGYNSVSQIAADASGVYMAGSTDSTNLPVTAGAVQPTPPTQPGAPFFFVSKLDPTGQSLIFSTYLSGLPGQSTPVGLAVDASGDVYIAAATQNGSLPIPVGSQPFQGTVKGRNVGILKLSNTGTAILAGTYLGGSNIDYFEGLAVDSSGDVYLTGVTTSNDFPVKNPLQSVLGTSGSNGFAAELNPTMSALVYSTYLGANSTVSPNPSGSSLAVDSSGDAYIIGPASSDFPTTAGEQSNCPNGACGGFLIEIGAGGSAVVFSTLLDTSSANGVRVDTAGNVYVAGGLFDPNYPVVNPIEPCSTIAPGAGSDFVSEFSSAGALVFSTCLGNLGYGSGSGGQSELSLTLDNSGNVYVADSSGPGLPLQNPIDANSPPTTGDCLSRPFVMEISPTTHTIVFSSFVGGPFSLCGFAGGDLITGVAVDPGGNIYLGGRTGLGNVPSFSYVPVFNAIQPYFSNVGCTSSCGYFDGFIMEISPSAGAAAALQPAELEFPATVVGSTSAAQTTTIFDLGTNALTVSNIAISGDFAITSSPCSTIAVSGGSCTVQVTFTPTALGTRNGTLTITDSSAGSPHEVVLTGTGVTGNLTPSPSSLTFSSQTVGTTSAAQTVTLTANGLAIQGLSIQESGDFSETNGCGTSIQAFGTCTLQITFTPTATGSRTGSITISDNAPNSPQTIALTGTATASIGLAVAAGGSASATVSAGSSATYSLSIGGQGMSGTASLACTGAPMGATCSVPATVSVSATNATTFAASVTTTSNGTVVPRFESFRSTPWLWAIVLIALLVILQRRHGWRWARACLVCFLFSAAVGLGSCGGGNGNSKSNGTPTGTYKLNVTAQVGSTSQSTTLTLTVQ
jgi:hypothetical protein